MKVLSSHSHVPLFGLWLIVGGSPVPVDSQAAEQVPPVRWITQAPQRSSGTAVGADLAIDSRGFVHVTGRFQGKTMFGEAILASGEFGSMFVAQYDPGGQMMWVRQGLSYGSGGSAIALDATGNVCVGGSFQRDIKFDRVSISRGDSWIVFYLAKYDRTGNVLWVQTGVSQTTVARDLATDRQGNVYAVGSFFGIVTFNSEGLTGHGQTDGFIAKYDPAGSLVWIRAVGGPQEDSIDAIEVDSNGSIFVTGSFEKTAVLGSVELTAKGGSDHFVARYDPDGTCIWAFAGGSENEDPQLGGHRDNAIAMVSQGDDLYIAGSFVGKARFLTMPLISAGGADLFVAKVSKAGVLSWIQTFGGIRYDFPRDLTIDLSGNVYVVGDFASPMLAAGSDTLTNSFQNTIARQFNSDAFAIRLDSRGGVVWAGRAGKQNVGGETFTAVAADQAGRIYLTSEYLYSDSLFDGGEVSNTIAADLPLRSLAASIGAPRLLSQPEAVTGLAGSSLQLAVELSGDLPLAYQWSRNGTAMVGETNRHMMLPALAVSDTGVYTLRIANRSGVEESRSIPITVVDRDETGGILETTLKGILLAGDYHVKSNLAVPAFKSFNMESGTRLLFDKDVKLTVEGQLDARATAERPIAFLAVTPTNRWWGMEVSGSVSFEHVEYAHASWGLQTYTPAVLISNSEVHDCGFGGISIEDGHISTSFIINNRIHDNAGFAIQVRALGGCFVNNPASSGATIIGNQIFDNTETGISVYGAGSSICWPSSGWAEALIEGNQVYSNKTGIYLAARPNSGGNLDVEVKNNLVFGNRVNGIELVGNSSAKAVLVNNTVARNSASGFLHDARTGANVQFVNNIVVANGVGVNAPEAATNPVVRLWANDVFGNATNWVNYPGTFGALTSTNRNSTPADFQMNISVDPLFVSAMDFRLQPGSPMANAGVSTNAPQLDFDGRPRGILVDLGAYEVSGAPTLHILGLSDGRARFGIAGEPNITAILQASADLRSWTAILTNRIMRDGFLSLEDPRTAPHRFYRVLGRYE